MIFNGQWVLQLLSHLKNELISTKMNEGNKESQVGVQRDKINGQVAIGSFPEWHFKQNLSVSSQSLMKIAMRITMQ